MAAETQNSPDTGAVPTPFSYAQAARRKTPSPAAATAAATPSAKPSSSPAPKARSQTPSERDDALDARTESSEAGKDSTAPSSLADHTPALDKSEDPATRLTNGTHTAAHDDGADRRSSFDEPKPVDRADDMSAAADGVESKAPQEDDAKAASIPVTLQDAPIPSVNVWQQRAQAYAMVQPSKESVTASKPAAETATDQTKTDARKSRPVSGAHDDAEPAARGSKGGSYQGRRDDHRSRREHEGTRTKGPLAASKTNDREGPAATAPVPSVQDQALWPTPESARDEDKRKRSEKDRPAAAPEKEEKPQRTHRNEWNKLDFTPSVVFNTPLPSGSRRGGRGSARGGRDASHRGGSFAANGADKSGAANGAAVNGEGYRRGRQGRSFSPSKERRASSEGSTPTGRADGYKGARDAGRGASVKRFEKDTAGDGQDAGNPSARHQPPRSRPGRRTEGAGAGDSWQDDSGRDASSRPSHDRPSAGQAADKAAASKTDDASEPQLPQRTGFGRGRGEPYHSHSMREGRSRGGRGGRHGSVPFVPNALHHGGQYANGILPPLQTPFSMPRSPTYPQDHTGFYASQPGRGYRANGRAQSVYVPDVHSRPSIPQPMSAVTPLQTMFGSYDFPHMQPMTPLPYGAASPYYEQMAVFATVSQQVDYYFSVDNLCKDMFLRKHMDSRGYVPLTVIADFNRLKALTNDLELIKLACFQSRTIEYRLTPEGKDVLRPRHGWEQWVLAMDERDPSAKHDGPDDAAVHVPPPPQPQGFEQQYTARYAQHVMPMPSQPSSFTPTMTPNGFMPVSPRIPSHFGQDEPSPVVSPPPEHPHVNGTSPGGPQESADATPADAFANEEIDRLSVIVRKGDTDPDGATPNGTHDDTATPPADPASTADSKQAGLARLHTEVDGGGTAEEAPVSPASTIFWVRDRDSPVHAMPPDATYEPYHDLRAKALDQRNASPHGHCPHDMNVLYQFWSHFLVRNFNTSMYDEFRRLAFDDESRRASAVGMVNLVHFYGEALANAAPVRERVAQDFVELVKRESPDEGRPAFRQLRTAWRDGALHVASRKHLGRHVDDDLKAQLDQ